MTESEKVFVLGGCRSGKSRFALACAEREGKNRIFIATLQPGDEEMKERIKRHQRDRGENWHTAEAPIELAATLKEHAQEGNVVLIDCLTLWISNLLIAGHTTEEILAKAEKLSKVVDSSPCTVILVSNKVGSGVVPDNRLGRDFRDAAGLVNQEIARICSKVVLVTAGIPQVIKNGVME
ncbi:bifunctional adenosylcobinamide kinase/adenosylcobinamide-phosphate guanylyltransferase [Planctomycetota bacterium]